jgi:Transposase domain (DUF772)
LPGSTRERGDRLCHREQLLSVRSERQLNYNLRYRWFIDLSPDDLLWDPTTFTKNHERLQAGEVFEKFMARLLNHPQVKSPLSDEHFSWTAR